MAHCARSGGRRPLRLHRRAGHSRSSCFSSCATLEASSRAVVSWPTRKPEPTGDRLDGLGRLDRLGTIGQLVDRLAGRNVFEY